MITDKNSSANDGRFESIEERLKAIEAQLWRNASSNQVIIEEDDQDMAESLDGDSPTISQANTPAILQDGTISPAFNLDKMEEFALPPLPDIQHVMASFFDGFNQATPLFNREKFLKMMDDWHNHPDQRDKASWSVINVVLAISLRHTALGQTIVGDKVASMCISNAQSAMDSLVYRDSDLKGLQVILGLALLFMATAHPQPACVLIATAVKLVHRLKLHVQKDEEDIDPQNTAERARLFWITYIIDRDLSLHTFEPYLLQDHDIGLDVDEIACEDGVGCLLLEDCQQRVEILKLRIRLAIIQGKVYDLIYSVRASKLSLSQKQAANDRLQRMLEEWYNLLPDSFKVDKISSLEARLRRHCISLHIVYYQCLFATRRASIRNTHWIKRLTEFSDASERRDHTGDAQSAALLPSNWSTLVEAARACLAMLKLIESTDTALRWSSTCACEAAITILAANNLTLTEHDLHDSIDSDADKIRIALEEFKQRIRDSDEAFLQTSYALCLDLSTRAASSVTKFREGASVEQFWDDDLSI
ncbi:hypothetical protein ACHAPJ_008157 [Fusarium lateritium]